MLGLGVTADQIIYAHPCKQVSSICYSQKVGVDLMTFDNETELRKIKRCFPSARLDKFRDEVLPTFLTVPLV